jgi:hypothetical protein
MRTISLSSTASFDVAYLWSPRRRGRLNHPIGCFARAHVVGLERAGLAVEPGNMLRPVDDTVPHVYALPSLRRRSISGRRAFASGQQQSCSRTPDAVSARLSPDRTFGTHHGSGRATPTYPDTAVAHGWGEGGSGRMLIRVVVCVCLEQVLCLCDCEESVRRFRWVPQDQ